MEKREIQLQKAASLLPDQFLNNNIAVFQSSKMWVKQVLAENLPDTFCSGINPNYAREAIKKAKTLFIAAPGTNSLQTAVENIEKYLIGFATQKDDIDVSSHNLGVYIDIICGRGGGAGMALIHRIEDYARQNGYAHITLHAVPSAVSFYRKKHDFKNLESCDATEPYDVYLNYERSQAPNATETDMQNFFKTLIKHGFVDQKDCTNQEVCPSGLLFTMKKCLSNVISKRRTLPALPEIKSLLKVERVILSGSVDEINYLLTVSSFESYIIEVDKILGIPRIVPLQSALDKWRKNKINWDVEPNAYMNASGNVIKIAYEYLGAWPFKNLTSETAPQLLIYLEKQRPLRFSIVESPYRHVGATRELLKV